jgi:hypothetical protein
VDGWALAIWEISEPYSNQGGTLLFVSHSEI